MLADSIDIADHYNPIIRQISLKKIGNNCGFHLTRSKWDPYPWISVVESESAAFHSGLKLGDCVLEVNGEDIIGRKISEIAEIVKSKNDVSLLLWNAGTDPKCTPEAMCCGPMPMNLQRLSACMSTILAFLECPICLENVNPPTYQCDNGHLICIKCRTKAERCPVCRLKFSRNISRSLLADQIYNTLIDAFNLREESVRNRDMKLQKIFKLKPKNIPDIKINQSQITYKFLARFSTKSNSLDNLSNPKFNRDTSLSASTVNINEFKTNLKMKSLSTNEIFHSISPLNSRANSVGRLNPNRKIESLDLFLINSENFNNFQSTENELLFYCPFLSSCTTMLKNQDLIRHFQTSHEGPLIQYFSPNVKISLKKVVKHKNLCYIISVDDKTFFLKLQLDLVKFEDVFIWTWISAEKNTAKQYNIKVRLNNESIKKCILSVQNNVYSLNSMSYQEIIDFKRAIFFNSKSVENMDNSLKSFVFDISIEKND